eukprot:g8377.t1
MQPQRPPSALLVHQVITTPGLLSDLALLLMRVLVVDAFAGSTSGREAFHKYEKLVRSTFQAEFCYDNEAVGFSSKAAISAVDKLDFVFVDGDSRLVPWHPRTRQAQEVVLDATTGDFYTFDSKTDRWRAEGNMGIQKMKGGIGGVAAAILADASSGFDDNGCMKKSEVLVRVRPKSIQHRFLKHVPCGEFLAWSPGKWSIGEGTAACCRRSFAVLGASNRAGPEIVELDNCLATRFTSRQAYQHATGLLQSFVMHKNYLIRSQSRIDRGSDFVMKGFQQDDFDGLSVTSSHKQQQEAAATACAARRKAPEGAASRRRQQQGIPKDPAATVSGKRTAPFPRRPQPAEKPRLAPPHSTRSIRAVPATGRGRMQGKDLSLLAGRKGGGEGDGRYGAQRAAGGGDEGGLAGVGALTPHHGETRAHGVGKSRGVDPQGRRRVLMERVGEGLGLDLSPVIDALLLGKECDATTVPNDGQSPRTARTAPAAPGRAPGDGTGLTSCELGVVKADRNQMGEKTRHVFFSLGGGSVHDSVAASEQKHREEPQQAGDAATKPQQQAGDVATNTGTAVSHGNDNKQRFSANFGRREAWQSLDQPTIRTQGAQTQHLFTNPKRWTFSGSKTRGWSGIGEGTGFAKNTH